MRKQVALLVAVTALLTACSGVEKDAEYQTPGALREAVIAAGGECPGETVNGSAGDEEQRLQCSDTLTLRLFSEDEDLKTGELGIALGLTSDEAILTGPNWIVQGSAEELIELNEDLGGELSRG